MLNRSAPPVAVVPVLTYSDVVEAATWLSRVFGFSVRVRIGDHRAQLSLGTGAVIVADESHGRCPPPSGVGVTHSVLVKVDDVDAHCAAARSAGADIVGPPADAPFGERQYSARDLGGHLWTFTQSVVDMAPEEWGGETVEAWGTLGSG